MKARTLAWLRFTLFFVILAVMIAEPSLAKDEEHLPPYDVDALAHSKIWVPWICAFLFAAGIIGIAFKNPHRNVGERE